MVSTQVYGYVLPRARAGSVELGDVRRIRRPFAGASPSIFAIQGAEHHGLRRNGLGDTGLHQLAHVSRIFAGEVLERHLVSRRPRVGQTPRLACGHPGAVVFKSILPIDLKVRSGTDGYVHGLSGGWVDIRLTRGARRLQIAQWAPFGRAVSRTLLSEAGCTENLGVVLTWSE